MVSILFLVFYIRLRFRRPNNLFYVEENLIKISHVRWKHFLVFLGISIRAYFIYQSNITATRNLMNRGLLEVEVTCQLTNRGVWIFFNLCNNSVNVDLCYQGTFPSTVFRIRNGQLAAFFKLIVPPKNCSSSEQTISVHAFHFVKRLRSHQAVSNTILHNKPLLRLRFQIEVYC